MSIPDPTHTRILEAAEQLFMRYGIRSISMDEVARHLAMSKKTLYQYFENKDELVVQMAKRHSESDCTKWEAMRIEALAKSALEETIMVGNMMRKKMAEMNPVIIYEMKRYHPRAWQVFEEHRETLMAESITSNILRGQQEGYYQANINPKIMARARMASVTSAFDQEIFPTDSFDLAEVQEQLLEHYVRGLLTQKGLTEWERLRTLTPLLYPANRNQAV
jgi:AcrR family transcriptional regulator